MPETLDLTGMRFGRLVAVEQAEHIRSGNRYRVAWRCICDCGNQTIVTADSLRARANNASSCGCYRLDVVTTHGGSEWPEYQAWRAMLHRCYNEQNQKFKHYGARGITVCDRWRFGENGQHPFECFIADIGRRPPSPAGAGRSQLSIDRIDNNDSYRPGNVRWATREQQARNKRTYKGGFQRHSRRFRTRIDGRWRYFKTFEEARAAAG
jgi:hypothetical protein